MKKTSLFLLALSLSIGTVNQTEAVALKIGGPGVVFTNQQPVQVIIIDSNGNTLDKTIYYNPEIEGLDLDASWAGPNASIYIPSLGTGYLWYNGFWVNQDGYYWDHGRRVYVTDVPQWRTHWTGYWHNHTHGRDGHRDGWGDRNHHDWRNKDRGLDDREKPRDFNGRKFDRDQKGPAPDGRDRGIGQGQRGGQGREGHDRAVKFSL